MSFIFLHKGCLKSYVSFWYVGLCFKLLFLLPFFFYSPLAAQQTSGLFLNDSLAFQGYTLFGNNETTYLIDNCGLVVNTWESDYKPGESIYLLENGNLLRTAELDSDFSAGGLGGRFELFSWEGTLLWSYDFVSEDLHPHHDIEPLPNGNFLCIAWEKITEEEAQENGRQFGGDLWSERIVELEMVGTNEANIKWEWRLWDHLIQDHDNSKQNYGTISDHPELVNLNYIGEGEETSGNWIHLNAIDYNATLDQIAVSSRLFSEVWIIDHSTTSEEAATHTGGQSGNGGDLLYRFGNPQTYNRGTTADQIFRHQHDIRWIPEGHPHSGKLMAFNNDAMESESQVVIWEPPINETDTYELFENEAYGPADLGWSYMAAGFYSPYMSSAEVLPNGHLFICEGSSGHFFELDTEGKLVWDYINPVNSNGSPAVQGGTVRFNQTFRATKYPLDYPAFSDKTLEGTIPVEINPWETDCFIPNLNYTSDKDININILGNPVKDLLRLESNSERFVELRIFNAIGQLIRKMPINEGINTMELEELPSGIYFLFFSNATKFSQIHKIIVK